MELRRRSSTPQDAASRAPRFGNSLRIAPREASGTEGSNPAVSRGEASANLTSSPAATPQEAGHPRQGWRPVCVRAIARFKGSMPFLAITVFDMRRADRDVGVLG